MTYAFFVFDQGAWLIGNGIDPVSAMGHVHVLAD